MCSYRGLHPLLGATGRMAGFYKRPLGFSPSPGRLCLYAWPWQTESPCHSPGRTHLCSAKKKRNTFNTLVLNFSMTKTFWQSPQTRSEKKTNCQTVWGVRPVAWPQHSRGAATPHWGCSGPSPWWHLWSPCWSAAWLHTTAGRKAHPLFPAERGRKLQSKIRPVLILLNQCFCNHCKLY